MQYTRLAMASIRVVIANESITLNGSIIAEIRVWIQLLSRNWEWLPLFCSLDFRAKRLLWTVKKFPCSKSKENHLSFPAAKKKEMRNYFFCCSKAGNIKNEGNKSIIKEAIIKINDKNSLFLLFPLYIQSVSGEYFLESKVELVKKLITYFEWKCRIH